MSRDLKEVSHESIYSEENSRKERKQQLHRTGLFHHKEARMLEKSEQGKEKEETSCGEVVTVSEESRQDYHLQPLVRTLSRNSHSGILSRKAGEMI